MVKTFKQMVKGIVPHTLSVIFNTIIAVSGKTLYTETSVYIPSSGRGMYEMMLIFGIITIILLFIELLLMLLSIDKYIIWFDLSSKKKKRIIFSTILIIPWLIQYIGYIGVNEMFDGYSTINGETFIIGCGMLCIPMFLLLVILVIMKFCHITLYGPNRKYWNDCLMSELHKI